MEGLFTKHLPFSLLAKNLKKRSFEARSINNSWQILGFFDPVLRPPAWQVLLSSWRWSTGSGSGSESSADVQGACRQFFLGNQDPCNSVILDISRIFLSQSGSISSSKFENFLPV